MKTSLTLLLSSKHSNSTKRTFLLLCFTFIASFAFSQDVDSLAATKEVDSLIAVCRKMIIASDFDKALQVIEHAKNRTLAAFGQQSALYAKCLVNQGRTYYISGKFPEAEKSWQESKEIRGNVLGKEHPDYANSLNNLGILYSVTGDYAKAELMYLEAKAIREKALGKEHPDYAASLNNLAILYQREGDYAKAELLYLEAKAIREKTLGKEHPDYAQSVFNLATTYYLKGEYAKAEPMHLEAKAIREKALGKEHPDYAQSLNNLALLYRTLGDDDKVELLQLESKAIQKKTKGKEHPDYAQSVFNLAATYYIKGEYAKAESLYLEIKDVYAKTLGKGSVEYAQSLQELANIYRVKGDYSKVEPLYLEVNDIYLKTLGKENPEYALLLQRLANFYQDKGDYSKAEILYLDAKEISAKNFGREHSDYASVLVNLASLYQAKNDFAKAESLLLEAKEIHSKTLGKRHDGYATCLLNLSQVYAIRGGFDKAEKCCLEAVSIFVKTLGTEHYRYAASLQNLAAIYFDKGDYAKAETCFLEAKNIYERTLSKEHPEATGILLELGMVYTGQRQFDKAAKYFLTYGRSEQDLVLKSARYSSQNEMLAYLQTFEKGMDIFYSFTHIYPESKIACASYENTLFKKGFLLNIALQIKNKLHSDTASAVKYEILSNYHRRLAMEYTKPIAERDSARVVSLEGKVNTLEKELTRTVTGFGETLQQVHWQEVQAKLKPGSVAIEFAHYRYFTPNATDSTMYAALILRPLSAHARQGLAGGEDLSKEIEDPVPQFIPLFEAQTLKALMRGASGGSNFLKINTLYSQKALYDLIWKPLEPLLTGIKTVYCSPSGLLHRINLAAIATPEGKSYGDRRQLVVLGSTRSLAVGTKESQLVVPNNSNPSSTNDAYLAGGIRYDSDSTAVAYANRGASSRSIEPSGLAFQPDSLSITRGGVLDYLPATASEVREIGQTIQIAGLEAKIDTGFYATEESFRQLGVGSPSPRIIHLATHGYFFPDPAVSKKQLNIGSEPVLKMSEHPMIRSGLIMAGAKQAWLTGKHPEGQEDGILTAYEISQMNLSGTELVVLSACETGLGDIVGNEGVYGLQRAFKIAGAKYLIMSLWKVDDQSTRAFMTSFYRHWLTEKQTVPEAFRSTQREMRAKYAGAYDWAGFVLIE